MLYDLQILEGPWGGGDGFGYGINDYGEVVGVVTMPFDPKVDANPGGPAIWMQPQAQANSPIVPYFPDWPTGGELLKVDNFGNAVGQVDDGSAAPWSAVVNGTSLIVDLRSLGKVLPSDINNQATVTGTDFSSTVDSNFGSRAFIYAFLPIPGNPIWLSPLPTSTGILANAINDLGDVVGGCDNNAGFFYSASTKKMTGIDSCFLNDINVNRLAVGLSVSGGLYTNQPVMVDLSKANPVVKSFLPPKPFVGAHATAVNSSNTIVGVCNSETLFDECAFVSYDGVEAFNLNDLISGSSSYTLVDAMDVNESGQIVGTAVSGPVDQPTGVYAYLATPFAVTPPPQGPVRSWPFPNYMWPWGWFPGWFPTPPSLFPTPMMRLSSPTSRAPIAGKGPSNLQKMVASHRARLGRPPVSKKYRPKKNKKRR